MHPNIVVFIEVIVVITVVFVPIINPSWIFGINYYLDQKGEKIYRKKQTILLFMVKQIMALVQTIIIDFAAALSLKGALTILIFLVIGFDLYFRKQLTNNAVVITIVGVIALYMEQLVQNAEEIDFKIFKYKAKK